MRICVGTFYMKAVFASALGARISSPVKTSPPGTASSDLSSLIALCTFRPGWLQLLLVTGRPIEKCGLQIKATALEQSACFSNAKRTAVNTTFESLGQ